MGNGARAFRRLASVDRKQRRSGLSSMCVLRWALGISQNLKR